MLLYFLVSFLLSFSFLCEESKSANGGFSALGAQVLLESVVGYDRFLTEGAGRESEY